MNIILACKYTYIQRQKRAIKPPNLCFEIKIRNIQQYLQNITQNILFV